MELRAAPQPTDETKRFILESALDTVVFEALAWEEVKVYHGTMDTYEPLEEEGPIGEIILQRKSDGKKFLIDVRLSVTEVSDE